MAARRVSYVGVVTSSRTGSKRRYTAYVEKHDSAGEVLKTAMRHASSREKARREARKAIKAPKGLRIHWVR